MKSFCNIECHGNYKTKIRWAKFEKDGDFKGAHNRTIKKYLIHKDGNRCSICGIEEWNKKSIIFIVDHIVRIGEKGDIVEENVIGKINLFKIKLSQDRAVRSARKPHKLEVGGSNPPPATIY